MMMKYFLISNEHIDFFFLLDSVINILGYLNFGANFD